MKLWAMLCLGLLMSTQVQAQVLKHEKTPDGKTVLLLERLSVNNKQSIKHVLTTFNPKGWQTKSEWIDGMPERLTVERQDARFRIVSTYEKGLSTNSKFSEFSSHAKPEDFTTRRDRQWGEGEETSIEFQYNQGSRSFKEAKRLMRKIPLQE